MTSSQQRPQLLQDFVGNPEIFGQGGILEEIFTAAYKNNEILPSLLICGNSGTGKTSLGMAYVTMFCSFSGSGEAFLRAKAAYKISYTTKMIKSGEFSKPELFKYLDDQEGASRLFPQQNRIPVVFIDEFHTLNQTQQGSLLSRVEQRKLVLVAATTQPLFRCVIEGLRSRCRVLQLSKLTEADIIKLLVRVLNNSQLPCFKDVSRSPEQLCPPDLIVQIALNAGGDARKAETILHTALQLNKDGGAAGSKDQKILTPELVSQAVRLSQSQLNPSGEATHRFVNALRLQDPQMAIFYMQAQLQFGVDPVAVCRQMLTFASEHASQEDLQLATSCIKAVENTGLPEAEIPMALTCIRLATATDPLGQDAVLGYKRAHQCVLDQRRQWEEMRPREDYRRDAAGPSYVYPHDFGGYVLDSAFQDGMQKGAFFGNVGL